MSAAAVDAMPMPWLAAPLQQVLDMPRAHAILLHAAPGAGALELIGQIAGAWLCEGSSPGSPACGACTACRAIAARMHPDLSWLIPEELRVRLGWQGDGDDGEGGSRAGGSRKPSRQIRIGDVRDAIDWITGTSSRGGAKVLVIHPAEALNPQSANALLKTLEEPPSAARLLLSTAEPGRLLPTLLSRCQRVRVPPPQADQAAAWLAGKGIAQPAVLLAASSGLPLDALAMAEAGIDAAAWTALPRQVAQGRGAGLAGWSIVRVVDVMQKICHDAMARAAGGPTRFFPADELPQHADIAALGRWSRDLARLAETAEHPWSEGLLVDALLVAARRALGERAQARATLQP